MSSTVLNYDLHLKSNAAPAQSWLETVKQTGLKHKAVSDFPLSISSRIISFWQLIVKELNGNTKLEVEETRKMAMKSEEGLRLHPCGSVQSHTGVSMM